MPLAVEAQSLNHWSAREVLSCLFYADTDVLVCFFQPLFWIDCLILSSPAPPVWILYIICLFIVVPQKF